MYFTKKVSLNEIPSLAVIEVGSEEIAHNLLFPIDSPAYLSGYFTVVVFEVVENVISVGTLQMNCAAFAAAEFDVCHSQDVQDA